MEFYKKIIKSKTTRRKIIHALRFIPDKPMLKFQYRLKTGRRLNLKNPQRYTEKLQWYKAYYRDPVMQQCADKYRVRQYVESKGLGDTLNDLYAVFDSPEDIAFENLPKEFVLKLSNGSGTNMLVEDRDALDLEAVRQKFKDFCAESGASVAREWVYTSTEKPVIIAERYLKDPAKADGSLRDYKIFCFAGKPAYTICVDGRNTDNYCHVVYDTEWVKQDVIIQGSSAAADYEKPAELSRMMEIAGILSEDFPFARVDLYFVEGKIYFGEITYFPWSGYKKFEPDSFDFDLGERFILPEKNV